MKEHIRELLKSYAEESYRDFSSALVPGSKPLLGVRLPVLRKIAKDLVKGDWRNEVAFFQNEWEDVWFEERMLRGMVIGYGTAKAETEEGLFYLKEMIPLIDCWSVCDSFCSSFSFAAGHRREVWEFLTPYLSSEKEYEVRVGLILLLSHFLKYDKDGHKTARKKVVTMEEIRSGTDTENGMDFPYLKGIIKILNREYHQGYYAQMAAAWTAAEAFVCFPQEMIKMFAADCRMDDWTRRKTLQKICESRNVDGEVKSYIKGLKG